MKNKYNEEMGLYIWKDTKLHGERGSPFVIDENGYWYLDDRSESWNHEFNMVAWGDSVRKATRLEVYLLITDEELRDKLKKYVDSSQ